jgi:predicted DNA-binding protein
MRKAQYTKPLTIALRPEVYEEVKRISDQQNTSMADFVRFAVETALSALNEKEEPMNGIE